MLSKEASSTIFWVFRMTRPGIEPRSPGPLANTLTARPILPDTRKVDLVFISKNKWCYRVDFAVPVANQGVKIKENEKIEKYLNHARELEAQWKMKMKLIPFEDNTLWMVLKVLEKENRGKIYHRRKRDIKTREMFIIILLFYELSLPEVPVV